MHTHPTHLFRIILDVDRYSQFLPLCSHSRVLRQRPSYAEQEQQQQFDATLTVGLPPLFEETYVSRVTANPNDWTVETVSTDSKLFDSLHSKWKLYPVVDNNDDDNTKCCRCDVHFEVTIAASDPIIVGTLDQVLQQVAGRQVAAFAERCQQVPFVEQEDAVKNTTPLATQQ